LEQKLLNKDNIGSESIDGLARFQLMRKPTRDFMARLDLMGTHQQLFKNGTCKELTPQELEQLRILVVGDRNLWMSRKPKASATSSKQFKGMKRQLQPIFKQLLDAKLSEELTR